MIRFYYPSKECLPLPASVEAYAAWQNRLAGAGQLVGPACWIVQTFLRVRAIGVQCELTQERPLEGIVVSHFDDMPATLRERARAYWVCVLADRTNIHPFAHFYIVQNPYQRLYTRQPARHILHWKQPGISPRDAARQRRFENIRFYGEKISLCAELLAPEFSQWCERQHLNFEIVPRAQWGDYSNCDVVIALRNPPDQWVHDKPASKLVNAWQAEVPAILGRESSFRAIGTPGVDYIEVESIAGLKAQLLKLKSDGELVESMVRAGRLRVDSVSDDRVAGMWKATLETSVTLHYERWRDSALRRSIDRTRARLLQGLAWRYKLVGTRFVDRAVKNSGA